MLLGLDYVVATAFGGGRTTDAHRALVDGVWLGARLGGRADRAPASDDPAAPADGDPTRRARERHPLSLRVDLEPRSAPRCSRRSAATCRRSGSCADHGDGHQRQRRERACLLDPRLRTPRGRRSAPPERGGRRPPRASTCRGCLVASSRGASGAIRPGLAHSCLETDWDRFDARPARASPRRCRSRRRSASSRSSRCSPPASRPACSRRTRSRSTRSAFTFMVPLGLSSAAAVRVGQALGRGDAEGASRAGWRRSRRARVHGDDGCLFLVARVDPPLFTSDARVLAKRRRGCCWVAGAFQLFDGTQVV